jgi:hypothetical protein
MNKNRFDALVKGQCSGANLSIKNRFPNAE